MTHQEDKVYLVIKMQSLLLCPLEWQWQRTHPGAWGREVPPALPHHLRHHCLPSLSLVFIRASTSPSTALVFVGPATAEARTKPFSISQCGEVHRSRAALSPNPLTVLSLFIHGLPFLLAQQPQQGHRS
ncbi:hypothetical protein NQZ68_003909 [Dissostichus eleginoides]|nr:hypothetical protein NQZ68_003909 [Dissostichus eleginoides]